MSPRRMFGGLPLTLLSLVSISVQLKDPLQDFCRLFGHQTAVVDRQLLIDGGLVNWAPVSATSLNYSSTSLRSADLDTNNGGFPQHTIVVKNDSVPSVNGGILWADEANKIVYQYGGEYNNGKPNDFQLWYYDVAYNTWNISKPAGVEVQRASWGAGAVAQDRAIGYYYGGWLTGASVPGYEARTPVSGMVVYDMLANTFRNESGPDDIPRAEGVMQYVPVGDAGLLVYFGGIEFSEGNGNASRGMAMSNILVYSIGDNRWYRETATGEVPEMRRRFCAGLAYAEDRSSYNIYLYGGASVGDGVGFGDVYVLSLPSFTWIKFWPRPEDKVGAVSPHHSLTCNVVNSQMIIMGGHFPNTTDNFCDVPDIYGQHGLDLGKQNSQGAKWASFNPNLTSYQVPNEITECIGGGSTGGATLVAPAAGFREGDLEVQFSRAYTPGVRDPIRAFPAKDGPPEPERIKSNKRAIIGGAVGGVVAILIICGGVFTAFWRRKKAKDAYAAQIDPMISTSGFLPHVEHVKSPDGALKGATFYSPTIASTHFSPSSQHGWPQWTHASPTHESPLPPYAGHTPDRSLPRDVKHTSLVQTPQELPATEPKELEATPAKFDFIVKLSPEPPKPRPKAAPPVSGSWIGRSGVGSVKKSLPSSPRDR
ncbi:hypothetical protein M011DRAFT_475920 [Sporormia fimetaria CBS 119925]|uniref:Galactose oxidase n=1 Tax=Sporormia fimetaria CBS 119925 TaxID=1340428 RepID=A0A6A6VEZ8_9PLEO|nr:hypothetical protein M011DRAFT_475920 [Sporormia fimetaria CBS 119925]